MTTRIPATGATARRHLHKPNGSIAADDRCPYCGSPISTAIRAQIAALENSNAATVERTIKDRFEREKRAGIEKARREAAKAAETKLQLIRQSQDAVVAARVSAERERATKKLDAAVNAEKLVHAAEKLKLETALAELTRKLQSRTPYQLGEPGEVDLHTVLTAAFPHDLVERVGKGVAGGDINMTIHGHGGESIGRIVLESKNHARWSNRFTEKLRSDMLAAEADFGVLVSNIFPANSGARELHLQDGVLVVSPSRAVIIVAFLRQQVIANHRLKLSAQARDEKGDRLLAFLTSPEATDHFDRLAKATDNMIDLEAREIDIQTGIHRKRGEMIRAIQASYEELVASIEGILGCNEPLETEAAI